jgi:hypothetical protein
MVMAAENDIPVVNLKETKISPEAVTRIPAKVATHYKIMPVSYQGGTLTIAAEAASDIYLVDEITAISAVPVRAVSAPLKDILDAIRQYYGVGAETIEQMMSSVEPSGAAVAASAAAMSMGPPGAKSGWLGVGSNGTHPTLGK